jgi:hypothetical protein
MLHPNHAATIVEERQRRFRAEAAARRHALGRRSRSNSGHKRSSSPAVIESTGIESTGAEVVELPRRIRWLGWTV